MLGEQWLNKSEVTPPAEFIAAVERLTGRTGRYSAQLLWQRGWRDLKTLPGFLDPTLYRASSPSCFGPEMTLATDRLQLARDRQEKVTIWGDFDADGVTSTSVLWDGLGQFFAQHLQLDYYIPNRLRESHGLNCPGIDNLAAAGTRLIVTCDTGSTNLEEINYARGLGIDIIVTDHHTLPDTRPEVVAIINPRYLTLDHPLYHLSGVAVAYKLVEALYQVLPEVPQQPLENLLDLVAIGLIADLVELRGDCRYLAQVGIKQLQKQVNPVTMTRPGVAKLLNFCKKSGDRPTDISFGLGPRINAVSRIHGDASFCVELLTSRDPERCQELAEAAELANTRRKSLQKDTIAQVTKKLQQLDLSTTAVIVLEDPQWQGGVLGLAAGQIAQEYGRPTVLLSSDSSEAITYAKGSARSVNGIDLYQLVKSQSSLLHRFGGHPFAAGLSLPLENLALFRQGINQQLQQQTDVNSLKPQVEVDLAVTVADLGADLFAELRQLEPYGMGNPIPKLLIKNCWFQKVWNKNIQDNRGNKIQYIRTSFEIWDDSINQGFPGLWWGHYKDDIPASRCDAIAELDFNTYSKRYEIRLVSLRIMSSNFDAGTPGLEPSQIIDRRTTGNNLADLALPLPQMNLLQQCPDNWSMLHQRYQQVHQSEQTLVLAYEPDSTDTPEEAWQRLVGLAKYLHRSQILVSKLQIQKKLNLGNKSFDFGLNALGQAGFSYQFANELYDFSLPQKAPQPELKSALNSFLLAIKEESFQQQYFYQVPLGTIQQQLANY